jgi:predicted SnoaL-like aldol condensation-catalyzing enzyme
MGAVDNDTLQAEIERTLQSLQDQPKHTKDQQLIVRKAVELYLVAFKYYDLDRTRALVHPNYKQHSTMATTDGQDSIIEVAGLMKSIAAKNLKGDGEPHFIIDVKRIMVDGEYVICQVHGRRWENDSGQHVFDMYRYRDGQFVEHWDVQMEVPPTTVTGNGNSLF